MMKRETKRRIAYYQDALPDMKKRVFAAALMLMIAVIVSITATYAWVTLSVAPVVSSVNTTMSANGALEIALSNPEGTEPEDKDFDESLTDEQRKNLTTLAVSNLKWGNLINLADDSYGIDNFVLRPAQLDTSNLSEDPLWGAIYGADGRITKVEGARYTYAKWNGSQFVGAGGELGVRAIASYELEVSDTTDQLVKVKEAAVTAAHSEVNTAYSKVSYKMPAMSPMITKYAQGKLDNTTSDNILFNAAEIKSAYELYVAVYDAMVAQKDAYVALANLQLYKYDMESFVATNWEKLVENKSQYNISDPSKTSTNGIVSLTGLVQFIADLQTAETDIATLKGYYEGLDNGTVEKVSWTQLSGIVSRLIDQGSMEIDKDGKGNWIKVTGLSKDNAGDLLDGKKKKIRILNGIVKRFEQLAVNETNRMRGEENGADMNITVKYIITVTIKGECRTTAEGSPYFMEDYNKTRDVQIIGKDVVAKDTVGMAVDFWLRTNAEETYVTLEGAVIDDGTEEKNIIKYDGVNRVWGSTENTSLTTNSTTQGGGSCYIYYADTPEDMTRSLDLLRGMKVAFVNSAGTLMATAGMDTESYYAVNGRVTVPLYIDHGVGYSYINDLNVEQQGLAVGKLTYDAAERITAIIYLDGARVSNDNVLAAADIEGQLNIQFGSSADLSTRGDNKLLVDERVVSATASPTSLDFTTAQGDAEALTTNVTVTVDGAEPERMTAFFVRAINATQGERQRPEMEFEKVGDVWVSDYVFDSPGTYYLRHVRLDGIDYALAEPPCVEVSGFTLQNVSWGEETEHAKVYSAESYYEESVTVKFATVVGGKRPSTVEARFINQEGKGITANLLYNASSGSWSGAAMFTTSDIYSLDFLVIDDEYMDLNAEGYNYELDLSLGMKVAVFNDGGRTQEEFDPEAERGTYFKPVGVKVLDNTNNELRVDYWICENKNCEEPFDGDPNDVENPTCSNCGGKAFKLVGGKLYYSLGGSTTNTVDTNLTWDEGSGWYSGILPIASPGRYVFQQARIGENSLRKATESPTYVIVSPDPPTYNASNSRSPDVQVVAYTNDAYIGPIDIDYAEAATLSAVVHNDKSGQDYPIVMSTMAENGSGTIYLEDGNWYINLPVYTNDLDGSGNPLANAEYTQEGTWTLKKISVWDCYDENTNLRTESNPIVWVAAEEYAAEDEAAIVVDFSKLTTRATCTINASLNPGEKTALGSLESHPFMFRHKVSELGMVVTLADDEGNKVTADRVNEVKLTIDYKHSTDADTYGYEVMSDADKPYYIEFKQDDSGDWVADTDIVWQYVGTYTVKGLSVTLSNNKTLDFSVPQTVYTVKSQPPAASDMEIKKDTTSTANKTTFEGLFLGTQSGRALGSLSVSLKTKADDTTSHALIPNLSFAVNLDYVAGTSKDYGGYTWTGDNPLTDISVPMEINAGYYIAGSTQLLAGKYTRTISVTIGDTTTTVPDWSDTIEVHSKQVSLTVPLDGYTKGEGQYVLLDTELLTDAGVHQFGYEDARESSWFDNPPSKLKGKYDIRPNSYDATNNICTVHIPLTQVTQTGRAAGREATFYALIHNDSAENAKGNSHNPCPQVKVQISNLNTSLTYGDITIPIEKGNYAGLSWTIKSGSYESDSIYIGKVAEVYETTVKKSYPIIGEQTCKADAVYFKTRTVLGTGEVTSVDIPYNNCTYTATLEKPLVIKNPY